MIDEGGLVEDTERDDDSLMLTINTPQRCLPYSIRFLFVRVQYSSGPAKHKKKPVKFTTRGDRHVEQTFQTKMTNNTHLVCINEGREQTTLITVTWGNPRCDICPVSSHKRSVPVSSH